jgi:hypothetical protein
MISFVIRLLHEPYLQFSCFLIVATTSLDSNGFWNWAPFSCDIHIALSIFDALFSCYSCLFAWVGCLHFLVHM